MTEKQRIAASALETLGFIASSKIADAEPKFQITSDILGLLQGMVGKNIVVDADGMIRIE